MKRKMDYPFQARYDRFSLGSWPVPLSRYVDYAGIGNHIKTEVINRM